MGEFSSVEGYHKKIVNERMTFNAQIAEIYKQKYFLEGLIKTLSANADAIDKWKESIQKLKGLLIDLKKNYEVPAGDCTGFPG